MYALRIFHSLLGKACFSMSTVLRIFMQQNQVQNAKSIASVQELSCLVLFLHWIILHDPLMSS